MSLTERLVADWYAARLTPLTASLAPLSFVFDVGVALRRGLYRVGLIRAHRLAAPVVVVGNVTVGGSGKTPLTIALATALAQRGWRPGIISRGYGGSATAPRRVTEDSNPDEVGDEPLLLSRTGLPVWIGRDRVAAGRALLDANPECDVVIADDGLQHYALARNVEIAVVDASRGVGNGWLLPAGPLRERRSRLDGVNAVVSLGETTPRASPREFAMTLTGNRFVRVNDTTITAGADAFRGNDVHAIAGIGNPARFFRDLQALGIAATCHAFPDHHRFAPDDLALPGARAILMTEKDAVKCSAFADGRCWALPVTAIVDPALITLIEETLRGS